MPEGYTNLFKRSVTLNLIEYGIEFIIEVLENALTEYKSWECNEEVAKMQKIASQICRSMVS